MVLGLGLVPEDGANPARPPWILLRMRCPQDRRPHNVLPHLLRQKQQHPLLRLRRVVFARDLVASLHITLLPLLKSAKKTFLSNMTSALQMVQLIPPLMGEVL